MTQRFSDDEHGDRGRDRAVEPMRYPTNHVVGILDTETQVTTAARALLDGSFLASEIDIATGAQAADRLRESAGGSGLTGLVIRAADHLGLDTEETEAKNRYERAMRQGRLVLRVAAPTEERKILAAHILRQHGAHSVNFFGRFTIEQMVPPAGP